MRGHNSKRRPPLFHGALLIDKPAGITSHDVVSLVRNAFDTREVGHAGTLDPIATGLLICLLGEGTKLSQYVMSEEKSYRVGVRFGIKTDSADISGQVISEKFPDELKAKMSATFLKEKIAALVGALKLPVPKYSAVKVAGKKLYEYARADEEVEIPVKEMVIKDVQLIESGVDRALIDLHCEKGTYVRSWVEKLGETMGCDATVETLRRIKSGPFDISQAHSADAVEKVAPEELKSFLVPLSDVLGGWLALKVIGRDESLVRNGQIPKGILGQVLQVGIREKGVRILNEQGGLLALILPDENRGLKIARVFN